jgi:hypothetical protein
MRILLIALIFIANACNTETVVADNSSNALIGTWNWVLTRGGIANLTIKPTATTQKKIVFDKEGKYQLIENNIVKFTYKYQLTDGNSITTTAKVPLIVFPDQDGAKLSYTIKKDSLFVFEEVYDGFGHTYVKAK